MKLQSLLLIFLFLVPLVQLKKSSEPLYTKNSKVVSINKENFSDLKSGEWLLEVYAPWCGFCKKLAPVWEELATDFGDNLKVGALDGDAEKGLSVRFFIKGYPSIFHIKDGEVRYFNQSSRTKESLKSWAKTGWSDEPVGYPVYYSPLGIAGTALSSLIDIATYAEEIHQYLKTEYGIPTYAILTLGAIIIAIASFVFGLILDQIISTIFGTNRQPPTKQHQNSNAKDSQVPKKSGPKASAPKPKGKNAKKKKPIKAE